MLTSQIHSDTVFDKVIISFKVSDTKGIQKRGEPTQKYGSSQKTKKYFYTNRDLIGAQRNN